MSADDKLWVDFAGKSTPRLIDENLRSGLAVLWRAYICAQDARADLWDFALRTGKLYGAGMTSSDLRWLVAKGFAEHGHEKSVYGDPHRSFHRSDGFFFDDETCLVLTPSGAALAEQVLRESVGSPQATLSAPAPFAGKTAALPDAPQATYKTNASAASALRPRWDARRHELLLGGLIVKRFRVPARNQETILSVFEEEGWPEHIDDPLPVTPNIDAPTRLHDAINRLNGCQINPLLRFHGNGNGTGVSWELIQPSTLR